ncbi:MAG: AAA family ATPase [Candidatus Dormibacteraeota bacterium]|nr:AAA family ATPase [Candidatus Dormibacteraeota bacterium]
MRVRSLSWANYRRLPDGHIEARNHLVLVGPNDSGKSSVLRAIYLCLGMPHVQLPASISARDFTDPAIPLRLSVALDGIEPEDRSAFPDEISLGDGETLRISIEATLDPGDPDVKVVRRFFPDSGHMRAPSRQQLEAIGFAYVPPVRSLLRELGSASGGAVRSLLSGLDLGADADALKAAAEQYQATLADSRALKEFRNEMSAALSAALPTPISSDELKVISEGDLLNDPLSGVTITLREADRDIPLAEQSDGIRALSVLTLLGISHKTARIFGVDEPETHLHPAAQRALARTMGMSSSQRVLVTHSASIVSQMHPLDIVAFRSDRTAHQLPIDAPIADLDATVRHWSTRLLEPLTARCILLLEGAADRILVERVAELAGWDLDRLGVARVELDGSGSFANAYRLFGPPGFDVRLVGLGDQDARAAWASAVGANPADLEAHGYVVCDPDLEGMYIEHLGGEAVIAMLLASPTVTEHSLLLACHAANLSDITNAQLADYCRGRRRKTQAALAVAHALDETQARALSPLIKLLSLTS